MPGLWELMLRLGLNIRSMKAEGLWESRIGVSGVIDLYSLEDANTTWGVRLELAPQYKLNI